MSDLRVGPKGYVHGWKKVGVPVGSAANALTAKPKPASELQGMDTGQLKALDAEFKRRAELLGKKGQVSKAHKAVLDELKKRGVRSGVEGEQMSDQMSDQIAAPARPDLGVCVRAFQWESRADSDGRTLEGYAAVFNSPATIRDLVGEFEEVILPGAFTRSLEKRTPVLQFEHGRDPRVGAVPIGRIHDIREDTQGLYVRARLFDNATVEPVREAIAEGAISGMSFRFSVPQGGDEWSKPKSGLERREIREADTAECGPVVFPAYDQTSVSVRSLLAQLDPAEHRALLRELAAEFRLAADLENFTGRPDARSAGGGDAGDEPGNGETPLSLSARARHRVLRMKGII